MSIEPRSRLDGLVDTAAFPAGDTVPLPSSQVSPKSVAGEVAALLPPKSTMRSRPESKLIACAARTAGAALVQSRVHCDPSHSHVSLVGPRSYGWMWSPPNSTVLLRSESNAIEAQKRA